MLLLILHSSTWLRCHWLEFFHSVKLYERRCHSSDRHSKRVKFKFGANDPFRVSSISCDHSIRPPKTLETVPQTRHSNKFCKTPGSRLWNKAAPSGTSTHADAAPAEHPWCALEWSFMLSSLRNLHPSECLRRADSVSCLVWKSSTECQRKKSNAWESEKLHTPLWYWLKGFWLQKCKLSKNSDGRETDGVEGTRCLLCYMKMWSLGLRHENKKFERK